MYAIRCLSCSAELGAYPLGELAAALLLHHGGGPHAGAHHKLEVAELPAGLVEVRIACQHGGCGAPEPRAWRVPLAIVPAVVIQHHAQHEGHAFRLWVDGAEVRGGTLAEPPAPAA